MGLFEPTIQEGLAHDAMKHHEDKKNEADQKAAEREKQEADKKHEEAMKNGEIDLNL
jgi:hypothetical protein